MGRSRPFFTALLALIGLTSAAGVELARRVPRGHEGAAAAVTSRDVSAPMLFAAPRSASNIFVARSRGYRVAVSPAGAVLTLTSTRQRTDLALRFASGNSARISPLDPQPARINYLKGPTSSWRTGVPTFGRVRIESIYPGIDALFYGTDGQLEYDLIVAPGSSPGQIRLAVDGADAVSLQDGAVKLRAAGRTITQARAVAYQNVNGRRVAVPVAYALHNHEITFDVGAYDRSLPLVIDPVLYYSTFFGATGPDEAWNVAADSQGAAYLVGRAMSDDMPAPIARPHVAPSPNGPYSDDDAYVAKFNPDGTAAWVSFIGGNDWDKAGAVGVGPDGDIYVGGVTHSPDFPTTAGAFHPAPPAAGPDEFLVRLSPDGTTFRYSTCLGAEQGRWNSWVNALTVDAQGRAYIVGTTGSFRFPVSASGNHSATGPSDDYPDAFVARFSSDGARLDFASLLGGSYADGGNAMAVDANGGVYVTGTTCSPDFPVRNALYPQTFDITSPDETECLGDGFLSYVWTDGDIVFSTYLGGNSYDNMTAVDIGLYDRVYVAGSTASDGTDSFGIRKPSPAGTYDSGIIYEIAPNGSSLIQTRYVGGTAESQIHGLVISPDKQWLWLLGSTDGAGWTYVGYPDAPAQGHPGGGADLFLQKWDWQLSTLNYSDTFGGSDNEYATGIARNRIGDLYISGYTRSANYPIMKRPLTPWVQTAIKPVSPQIFGDVPQDGILTSFACDIHENGPTPIVPAAGGSGQTWTLVEDGCAVEAVSDSPWLHITGRSGSNVTFTADPNPTASDRWARIIISGRDYVSIAQAAGTGSGGTTPIDEIVLNARDVSVVRGTWTVQPDGVHGSILVQPDAGAAKIGTASAAPANYFEFTFNADAGKPYHLWIHGRAQNDSWQNDSAYVQFSDSIDASGNPIDRINSSSAEWVSLEECSGCGEQGWGWQDNAYGTPGNLGPNIVFANSGPHTIRVQQREDGFQIGQIVLSAAQYLSTAPGAARNDPTIVGTPTATTSVDEIVIWTAASSPTANGTWSYRTDASAAGSASLWNPDNGVPKLSAPLASPANYFDIAFDADAGKPYHLWLRMKADNDSWQNDSVWIQFSNSVDANGNAVNRIGTTSGAWVSLEECTGCGEQGWGWQDNAYGSPGNLGAPIYFATSGSQTIRVQVREDGASVDQIVLSAGQFAARAPGPAKNDNTILPATSKQ